MTDPVNIIALQRVENGLEEAPEKLIKQHLA